MSSASFGGVIIGCGIFERWGWGAVSRWAGYVGFLADDDDACGIVSGFHFCAENGATCVVVACEGGVGSLLTSAGMSVCSCL